ncbi:hypothetical protein Tco_1515888 [Tanacetum coccineum]
MKGYKANNLKGKSFDVIKKMFDKAYKRVNAFVAMGTEVVEGSGKKAESSRKKAEGSKKRAGAELGEESIKRQKLEDDVEKAELKLESYYIVKRSDGSSKMYMVFSKMLKDFDRQDFLDIYRLVKERYNITRPEAEALLLWGNFITMFEPSNVYIHMLVERRYPLEQVTLSRMLSGRLQIDHECEMAYELLKFTKSQFKGGLLGLKVFLMLFMVNAAQFKLLLLVKVTTAQEVQRKYSKLLLLLELKLLMLVRKLMLLKELQLLVNIKLMLIEKINADEEITT